MTPVSVSLFVFFLYLIFQSRYPSVWTFFAAPTIGPLATALFFTVHPLNPYRNPYAQSEGKDEAVIMRDTSAQRLVSLLASRQARIFVLKTGFWNSLILTSIALVGSFFRAEPLPTTFIAGEVFGFTFLFSMASLGLQGTLLLRWALRKWREKIQ